MERAARTLRREDDETRAAKRDMMKSSVEGGVGVDGRTSFEEAGELHPVEGAG